MVGESQSQEYRSPQPVFDRGFWSEECADEEEKGGADEEEVQWVDLYGCRLFPYRSAESEEAQTNTNRDHVHEIRFDAVRRNRCFFGRSVLFLRRFPISSAVSGVMIFQFRWVRFKHLVQCEAHEDQAGRAE